MEPDQVLKTVDAAVRALPDLEALRYLQRLADGVEARLIEARMGTHFPKAKR